MDGKTAEIRCGKWVQTIQDWSSSGLSKRDYCRSNGIDEKQFYYYQRRIRSIIAEQGLSEAAENLVTSLIAISAREATYGKRQL